MTFELPKFEPTLPSNNDVIATCGELDYTVTYPELYDATYDIFTVS